MPAFTGDVTSSAGSNTLTLGTVPVSKGGTGATSFGANKLVSTNGTGTQLAAFSCATGQVPKFDGGGVLGCDTVANLLGYTPVNKAGDSSVGSLDFTSGNHVRFGHANQSDGNDGKIGANLFGAGLNIVGTQTTAAAGRKITMFGDLILNGGLNTSGAITQNGNQVWHAGNFNPASYQTSLGYTPVNKAGDTMTGRLAQSVSGFHVADKASIATRTDSGFYQTSAASTANGWPTNSGGWFHLMSSTHSNDANYYSMQFAGDFYNSNELYYRATSGSGTAPWNKIWHAGNLSNLNQLTNGPGYITGITSGNVTTALGYTPVNKAGDTMTGTLNISGSGALQVGGNTVIDAGGGWHRTYNATGWYNHTYGGGIYMDEANYVKTYGGKGFYAQNGLMVRGVVPGDTHAVNAQTSNAAGAGVLGYSQNGAAYGLLGHANTYAFYGVGAGYLSGTFNAGNLQVGGNNVWHAGNLTNLNQLSNGPGYITGITSGMITTALGYTPMNGGLYVGSRSTSGQGIGYTGSGGGSAEVQGVGGGAAMMSFHRPGAYAVNFGLDTDNVLKVGGWSMGGAAYTIWHSGTFDPGSKMSLNAWQGNSYIGTDGAHYGTIFYDSNNTGYYVDPNGVSNVNDMRAQIFYDGGNTGFYLQPRATSVMNVAHISFIYDRDNTGYYLDPAGTTSMNAAYAHAYYYHSDARLKHDLRPIESPLGKVLSMKGVRFKWNGSNEEDIGFIAQDMQKIAPEMVSEKKDPNKPDEQGILGVKYGNVVSIVVEAVKEVWAKVMNHDGRIQKLEAENAELKARLDRLEKALDKRVPASK